MADTARASATSLQRDEILEAVAFAAERFLRASQWRDVAPEVLARLGPAADVSRAYIVENVPGPDARLVASWVAEWTELGVLQLLDDPLTSAAPWDAHFARWARLLARGQPVLGSVLDFPASESEILSAHGVASLVSLPVFVGETWWGSIGFDDCRGNREWIGPALDGLRTAASILSAAIERQRSDEQLREAERRYRSFVERIPAVTYTDIAENGVVRMGFVSPQIEGSSATPHRTSWTTRPCGRA
jgi:GAF domain-containing protein